MIEIDISLPIPIFEQLMAQIGIAIMNGKIQADDKIPSIRQLAQDLEINPNTVAKAYQILEEAQIIKTNGRSGSKVTQNAKEAYQKWLIKMTKKDLILSWQKLRDLSGDSQLSQKVWKKAQKDFQNEN
jgi:GntR family transcriptional regulator